MTKTQAKRLNSKEYEATLSIMRRWPEPYRALMAKVIHHVSWQFSEIQRLDNRLKELEQVGLAEATTKAYIPKSPTPAYVSHVPTTEKWPLYKRLDYIYRTEGFEGLAWSQTCKWNSITDEKAREILRDYQLSLDKP